VILPLAVLFLNYRQTASAATINVMMLVGLILFEPSMHPTAISHACQIKRRNCRPALITAAQRFGISLQRLEESLESLVRNFRTTNTLMCSLSEPKKWSWFSMMSVSSGGRVTDRIGGDKWSKNCKVCSYASFV